MAQIMGARSPEEERALGAGVIRETFPRTTGLGLRELGAASDDLRARPGWCWEGRAWQLWLEPTVILEFPRAFQMPESKGGVGCPSCLAPSVPATAGKPWVVPSANQHILPFPDTEVG